MNFILEIFIKNRFLKITDSLLDRWNEGKKINNLMYAAKNGDTSVRLKCAEIFGNYLNFKEVEDQLFIMVFDEADEVSRRSIQSIQKSSDVELHQKLEQRILERNRPGRWKRGSIGTSESYYHKPLSHQRSDPLEDQQKKWTNLGAGSGIPSI